MNLKQNIPDAWDDDWTNVADTKVGSTPDIEYTSDRHQVKAEFQPAVKLSKAEKRQQHQQLQQELWSSAEDPSRNIWLEAQGALPLKQDFVPTMTVLSRKPQVAKREPVNGLAGLSLQDEEDDSEEEARKKREAELGERQRRAKLEREEKVRKYAEARERIMGTPVSASPKLKPDSRDSSQGRNDNRRQRAGNSVSQPTSRQSPIRSTANPNLLFDPEDMGRRLPKKQSPDLQPREGEPIRQPRGPDSTGKAGFAARNGP